MAKAKRVYEIAKALGVNSKDIVAKCQAESVPGIDNHMSTVKIGLEMTIKEWFSEAEPSTHTAVETAEKVDVTQAKARARKRAKKKPEPEATAAAAEDAPVTEAPAETGVEADTEAKAPPSVTETPAQAPAEEAEETAAPRKAGKATRARKAKPKPKPKEEEPAEAPPQLEVELTPETVAKPNVPQRPKEVKPAGPKLEAPKQAKLQGPKVVRIEKPDEIRAPRPRRQTEDVAAQQSDLLRSRGPERGKGAGGKPGEEDYGRSPRRKRGGGSGGGGRGESAGRRGRSATAEHTLKGKFSEQDLIEREERLSRSGGFLRRRQHDLKTRVGGGGTAQTPAQVGGKVEVEEPLTIKDLSAATGIKGADVVKFLFNKGVMATINQIIDTELAMEVCLEYNIELLVKEARSAEDLVAEELERREPIDVKRRPPVVAVLGHVDHGKTSLLDRIRQADVAVHEAGGITQHIGAYRATIRGTDGADKTVVFLDTPGHEAFTSMRARGANLTDIVVVVVAADDGVMPQTVESINHAKAAGVPVVIALNKIDTPQATEDNIRRILGQLAELELNPVEWGGDTEVLKTSAVTGEGVTELMEMLDYQAELLDLKADYGGAAYGQVIEAELSEGRGAVARILVRGGQLKVGDFIVMGRAEGRVRDMIDDRGQRQEQVGPATPVEISGISEVPDAGDKFYITDTLKKAQEIAEQTRDKERKQELAATSKVSLDTVFQQMQAGQVHELRVVIKADVQGSVEVLRKTLEEVGKDNAEVHVRVLHSAVGGITEADVTLAEASDAVIIGFQVIASQHARSEAEQRGVDIRLYRVIYDIIDDVKAALEGMLAPELREKVVGHAEVREVFRVSKVGMVAGCYVTDGEVRRNALIRVTRDDIVIEHDRLLSSLKRFKDDTKEVRAGMECGMSIDGYDDIRAGDILECYETAEVKKTL